jgi:hypothetical protein
MFFNKELDKQNRIYAKKNSCILSFDTQILTKHLSDYILYDKNNPFTFFFLFKYIYILFVCRVHLILFLLKE